MGRASAALEHCFSTLHCCWSEIKLAKCIFGANSIKCLGNVVSGHGVSVDPDKVAAMINLPPPSSLKALRSTLGMANYYRTYVPNFAAIVEPLTNLTRKHVPYVWSHECQVAYDELRNALISAPVLRLPDFNRPFVLTTDWSKLAVGAVLSQLDPITNFDHPIAFASRALSPAETRYSPTEGDPSLV